MKLTFEQKEAMAEKLIKLEQIVNQQRTQLDSLPNGRKPFTTSYRNGKTESAGNQPVAGKTAILRTCREIKVANPSLTSGMYWVDPDGQGIGDNPVYAYCDMSTGT